MEKWKFVARSFGFVCRCVLAGITVGACFGQEETREPPELTTLRLGWENADARDVRPTTLSYITALEGLRDNLTKAGRIADALVVRAEIQVVTTVSDPSESHTQNRENLPALKELRAVFDRETTKVRQTNMQKYVRALNQLKGRYSQAGNLDDAVPVLKEIERVERLQPAVREPENANVPESDNPASGAAMSDGEVPESTRALGSYLGNTVWDVKTAKGKPDGAFRFRGDATMSMSWHDFQWEPKSKREARMFTEAWSFNLKFADDMATFKAANNAGDLQWTGTFTKRICSTVAPERMEEILLSCKWKRPSEGNTYRFKKNGAVESLSPDGDITAWEIQQGVIILRGGESGRKIKDELLINSEDRPYVLLNLRGEVASPLLVEGAGAIKGAMGPVKEINLDGKWKVQTETVANEVTREFKGNVLIDDTGARRPIERKGNTVTISWGPGWFERLVIDPDNPDVLRGQNHDKTKITYIRIR